MKRIPKRPTTAFVAEVCKYVKSGCPVETAFRITLGAKWSLGFEWMAVGAGEARPELLRRKPYRDLLDAVTRAEAQAEIRHALIVQRRQSERWSAWWLSRRHPERWRASEHTEVPIGVPIVTKSGATIMLPEEMAAQIRALKSEPYQDPRALPEGDPEPKAAVVVEDVIEVRPGGDRPPKDDPADVEGRPPAAIPKVIKRPLVD